MITETLRRYGAVLPPRLLQIEADDGCSLAVHVLREAADSAALPTVFVHALAMDGHMWQGVADALPAGGGGGGGALYAMDCRGHGASGKPEGVFTTARLAQDIACVLDALQAARTHLVGCSMGGTVSLAFAGRYPRRLASLTAIDTTAWYGPDAPEAWERRAQSALQGGMSSLTTFQLERWFSPGFADAQPVLAQQAVNVFLANSVPAYAASCRMLGAADERAGLAAYTGPAAIVVGEHDYATPVAMAQDIVSRLAGASLAVIPGTRHYTPLEAPEAVADCIAAVMARAG